jgi:pyruvate formate lyase activating enzyme
MERISDIQGTVFNIKRFSVHDGPGIRTSVFLKGCPLQCIWCHNPEGINPEISIWYSRNICIRCGQCITVCPNEALTSDLMDNKFIKINYPKCNLTGNCVKICPTLALQFTGTVTTVSDLMNEVMKDMIFYRTSGGGLTLTGGEPAFQPGFCLGILKSAKSADIHTAIETCLYCEREVLETLIDFTDLFIVDIKIFDPAEHEKYTGKLNEKIKDNFRYLVTTKKNILVRVPLIKDITDTIENKYKIEKFVHEFNPDIPIEYLNFNPLTKNKYQRLCISFPLNKSNILL